MFLFLDHKEIFLGQGCCLIVPLLLVGQVRFVPRFGGSVSLEMLIYWLSRMVCTRKKKIFQLWPPIIMLKNIVASTGEGSYESEDRGMGDYGEGGGSTSSGYSGGSDSVGGAMGGEDSYGASEGSWGDSSGGYDGGGDSDGNSGGGFSDGGCFSG